MFLKENHERLGPALIAALTAAAAAACLAYVLRRSAPFSWERVPSPHLAADYLLLLAILLLASDLAYVEAQFRVLGPRWPHHLLAAAIVALAAAYRFDSRSALTLGLTSFAAWRGVSAGMPFAPGASAGSAGAVRWNAIACGALYVAVGALSRRARRKGHFEPLYVTAGLLLCYGAVLSGAWGPAGQWLVWLAALATLAGTGLAVFYRLRRPLDFAIALAAISLGGLRALGEIISGPWGFLLVAIWSVACLVVLVAATRRLRRAA